MNLPHKCINCGAGIDYSLPTDYIKPTRTVQLPSGSSVPESWKRDPNLGTYGLYLCVAAVGLTVEKLLHIGTPEDWFAIIAIAVGGSLLCRESWRQTFYQGPATVNTPAAKGVPGDVASRVTVAPGDSLQDEPTDPRTIPGMHFRCVSENKDGEPVELEFSHYVPGLENRKSGSKT